MKKVIDVVPKGGAVPIPDGRFFCDWQGKGVDFFQNCVIIHYVPLGGLAQLVRAPASHAGGRWFESISLHQTKHPIRLDGVFCLVLVFRVMDSNPSKCNADERCRRRLDGAEHLFSANGRKCNPSPLVSTIKEP